jgi:colanic acid biosynthesis glycosyl transferase WcaI
MRLLIHDYAGHPFQVQLSRELARRRHSVVHAFAGGLLTPRGSLDKKAEDPDTFEVVEVPMDAHYRRDKYRFLRRRRMEVDYGGKIAALIQKLKPEVVVSANTPTEPQLRLANTCSRLGIQFVPWIQDFYSVAVGKLAKKKLPVIGNLVAWWYRHLERCTLRQASAVVAITDDFVPMLRQFGVPSEKIAMIPNWGPLEELPQKPRRNEWSATHGLDDKFVFLYSGTLAMKHNPDILRQLAVKFGKDAGVRVVVVSEGPGTDWLAERKKKESLSNLMLLPFQPFQGMPAVMASADVLIAVLEADAGIFSVPSKVLSYHCAGRSLLGGMPLQNLAARIILENRTGLCTAPDDFEGFIKAAERLRADGELRSQCGERARLYAENNFDIKKIADRFEECTMR